MIVPWHDRASAGAGVGPLATPSLSINRQKPSSGEATLKSTHLHIALILIMSLAISSCSSPAVSESTPEVRIREARKDMDKRRYEKAYENLEELRFVTAGTRLGGEVQFLLGEAGFKRGKYPEAESHYAAYLNSYPGGAFAEQAVYMQAMSKVKQLEKRKVGFFSYKAYIPHDRDIFLLREARTLFEIYVEMYPTGQWIDTAREKAEDLLLKEGMHELEVASFYLKKKKSPTSALARARKVLEGDYPESIMAEARELIREAQASLDQVEDSQDL